MAELKITDVFAQLQLQDGMFPVVRIDDSFVVPLGIRKAMEWK